MKKILILLAHPKFEHSVVNKTLIRQVQNLENVYVHDLYEHYPDFNIDINREKQLLLDHDIIIWQHPFYWYSCPPLMKQWIDLVLEFRWAYGPNGKALEGKLIFNSITSGGGEDAYKHEGRNKYTLLEFLAPFKQTAHLCHMVYLPPFAIQGTHKITKEDLQSKIEIFKNILIQLRDSTLDIENVLSKETLHSSITI